MSERFKLSLSGMWLIASCFSIILPIFLPSSVNAPSIVANSIGAATATMFLLSFPISLFGIPLLFAASYVLGVEPNSIQGMYVNLLVLFALGLVQWFWMAPRLLHRGSTVQSLAIDHAPLVPTLAAPVTCDRPDFFDSNNRTPVERVIEQELEQ